jgi:SAM-dependent methyltransferase
MKEPNAEQAALWNEASGSAWVEMQAVLDGLLAPFEAKLTSEAFPGEGRRVLDIGCGAGATTLAMARLLGSSGGCLGVDISAPLVAAARARATAEGLSSAQFVQADAQTYAFEPAAFDAVISRFGVMFFDDPSAAFGNIRRAAKRDATLTFVAWRSPAENPFMTAAARAAAPFLPNLVPPNPDAPGQFAFADAERVRGILGAGGFRDIELDRLDVTCSVPQSDLFAYVTKLGPVGVALRVADDDTRARTVTAVRAAFEPFVEGDIALVDAATWLVRARA